MEYCPVMEPNLKLPIVRTEAARILLELQQASVVVENGVEFLHRPQIKSSLLPEVILIRQSYKLLLDLLDETLGGVFTGRRLMPQVAKNNHFVIMGTPGIGKTLFGFVLVKKLLDQGASFLYHAHTSPTDHTLV